MSFQLDNISAERRPGYSRARSAKSIHLVPFGSAEATRKTEAADDALDDDDDDELAEEEEEDRLRCFFDLFLRSPFFFFLSFC